MCIYCMLLECIADVVLERPIPPLMADEKLHGGQNVYIFWATTTNHNQIRGIAASRYMNHNPTYIYKSRKQNNHGNQK